MKRIEVKGKEFYIVPEAGVVKGRMPLKWVENDLRHGIKPVYKRIISYGMGLISPSSVLWNFIDNTLCWNDQYVEAVAKCEPDDKFDETTGIGVCAAKMELKNHLKLAKAYDRLHRVLVETAVIVGEYCIKHTEKANAIEDDLVKYYGRKKV